MGLRFRKSFNLGGGFRLNLNKKSVGLSVGTKGVRYSVNSDGRKTASVGIPGTGLYWTESKTKNSKKSGFFWILAWIIFFPFFVIYYLFKFIINMLKKLFVDE